MYVISSCIGFRKQIPQSFQLLGSRSVASVGRPRQGTNLNSQQRVALSSLTVSTSVPRRRASVQSQIYTMCLRLCVPTRLHFRHGQNISPGCWRISTPQWVLMLILFIRIQNLLEFIGNLQLEAYLQKLESTK